MELMRSDFLLDTNIAIALLMNEPLAINFALEHYEKNKA
jgi:hypothetical protein